MGGGGTKTTDSSTQSVQLPAWMSSAGQDLFNKTMSDSAASPVTQYGGQLTAPTSTNQDQASTMAADNAGAGSGQVGAGSILSILGGTGTGDRVGASSFTPAAASSYMSPYVSDVQDRTLQEMQRQGQIQMAGAGDSAEAAHAYGGTRQGVQDAETAKGINNNMLDYLANSNQAAYENAQGQFNTDADRSLTAGTTNAGLDQQELDRQVAAGAALGNLGQQASGVNAESINNLSKTGAVDQSATDAADQAAYQEYLRMQNGTVGRDQDIMSILAGTPRNVTTTGSGTSNTQQTMGLGQLLMGGAGMAASIWSDPRLKRDAILIRTHDDGLPEYEFEYVDDDALPAGRFRGVMADEVAEFRPEALGPTINGFATVDASLAPQHVGG